MLDQNTITTWILRDNLRLFLERVSAYIGSGFEDWDWDAIRFGIQDADTRQDPWYEYTLFGSPSVALWFAEAEDVDRLQIQSKTEDNIAVRISAIARIMQCWTAAAGTSELEILIELAFIEMPRPNGGKIVSCSAAHLANCPECRETLSFFRDKHWLTLVQEAAPLPRTYAGTAFLTPGAVRFFSPAYLLEAIRDCDEGALDIILEHKESVAWTPLQEELIVFARHLLKLCTQVRLLQNSSSFDVVH